MRRTLRPHPAATLLVFAKAPRLGQGKTRLAADIGAVQALRINRFLQSRAMRAAFDPRWRTLLVVTPDRAACRLWPPAPRVAQGRGDLGARLVRAFAAQSGPTAVIGTDAPGMTRAAIWRGFRALKRRRFAMGPAEDGGFWLFAARRPRDAIPAFADVRWSTAAAAADLLARLPGPCAWIDRLRDIDTLDDWRRWRARR